MFNPFQVIKAINNPQAFMEKMMGDSQIMQNPMARNIMDMAQKGDIKSIEQMGRNIAKEKGIDFDKAFSDFKKQFPINK